MLLVGEMGWGLETPASSVHLLRRPQLSSRLTLLQCLGLTGPLEVKITAPSEPIAPLGVSEHQVPVLILPKSAALPVLFGVLLLLLLMV